MHFIILPGRIGSNASGDIPETTPIFLSVLCGSRFFIGSKNATTEVTEETQRYPSELKVMARPVPKFYFRGSGAEFAAKRGRSVNRWNCLHPNYTCFRLPAWGSGSA